MNKVDFSKYQTAAEKRVNVSYKIKETASKTFKESKKEYASRGLPAIDFDAYIEDQLLALAEYMDQEVLNATGTVIDEDKK